jgi:O-antigen/teichoic acid export membrane protein
MKINIIKTILYETLNRLSTLTIVLLISKNFSIEDYGHFSLFISLTSVGQTIIDFGSQNYGVKELIKSINNEEINSKIKTIFEFRIIGLVIWIILSSLYFFVANNNSMFYILLSWGVIYCFYCDWILKGINKISSQALINLISNSFSLFILLLIINYSINLNIDFIITVVKILPLIFAAIFFSFIFKSENLNFPALSFSKNILSGHFRESFHFLLGSFSARSYNSLGLILLGFFESATILGAVSYAFTFYNIFGMARAIIVNSLYPYYCKLELLKALKLTLLLNLISSFAFLIFFISYLFFDKILMYLIVPNSI